MLVKIETPPNSIAPDRTEVDVGIDLNEDATNEEWRLVDDIEDAVLRAEERAYELLFRDAISDIIENATRR